MWGAAFALLALAATPQGEVFLTGRVVRVSGGDTVGVTGARVVLHRVMSTRQGPIDSTLSGSNGAFRFRFHPDSGAIFLTSARWAGIEYFAPPVSLAGGSRPEPVVVTVADTAAGAPVGLSARHVVVSAPATDGTRSVLELLVLENHGPFTRVPRDTAAATWLIVLPPQVARIELGDTDFATDVIEVRGDTLRIRAPLPPGQRQLSVQYQLPAGLRRWTIPIQDSTAAMNVLIEESTATLAGPLLSTEPQEMQGKRFSRWKGSPRAGTAVVLDFDPTGTPPWLLPLLVTALGGGLALALLAARRRGHAVAATAPIRRATAPMLLPEAEVLLEQIAALDTAHSGGPTHHPPERWHAYLRERSRLKQQLEEHLPL